MFAERMVFAYALPASMPLRHTCLPTSSASRDNLPRPRSPSRFFPSPPRRKMGLQSLPVAFGVDTAKWICVSTIDVTQLGVAAYLAFGLKEYTYAGVLLALILPQVGPGEGAKDAGGLQGS